MSVVVAPEVRDALATAQPVVALESTIFSPFGLPAPANVEALDRCLAAVRTGGAVPALTAVLDGRPRVGLDPAEHERILTGGAKVAARDLAVAMARELGRGCDDRFGRTGTGRGGWDLCVRDRRNRRRAS